jgi:hypothetical protein
MAASAESAYRPYENTSFNCDMWNSFAYFRRPAFAPCERHVDGPTCILGTSLAAGHTSINVFGLRGQATARLPRSGGGWLG